jgi:DNA-binding XRE family transcriptional regulator
VVTLDILKTIGLGHQCVYVYYYPNDKKLAELSGFEVWECKIGMTTTGEAISRVIAQKSNTSRHQSPIIALEIRTDNAQKLESEIHRVFYADRIPPSKFSGDEWFITNPEIIENYFNSRVHVNKTTILQNYEYDVDDPVSLAYSIREIRKKQKLRQEDLGVLRTTVIQVENANRPITTETLFIMLENLNCKLKIVPKDCESV